MIFSQYARVVDLSWEKVLWGALWAVIIIGIVVAVIMYSSWTAGREDYKKNLPRKYKEQEAELKDLKVELKAVIKERDDLETSLTTILLSAEVQKFKRSTEVRGK